MKRFLDALAVLEKYEGGYADHRLDPGGQTYRGISRVYFPDWEGWSTIDNEPGIMTDGLTGRRFLDQLTAKFYREQFWNRFQGDLVADVSQNIAIELLECSVNMGVRRCVKHLQRSLNVLNRNQKLFSDIVDDGQLGPITLANLAEYLEIRPPSFDKSERRLIKVMNLMQGNHYLKKMQQYPEKEEFRGWFDRV